MCYEILHKREGLPEDGAALYCQLQRYNSDMHFQIHEEIFCPSNKFIDESKLNLLTYTTIIDIMFGEKYMELLDKVMAVRKRIFPIENVLTCIEEFDQLWNMVYSTFNKLCKDGYGIKLLDEFKTCDLFSVKSYKGICIFFINTHLIF